ncbi:hypothetical protein ACFE04_018841 [Oxalis oulophora]
MDVLFLANGISSSESRWNKDKKKYEDKAIDEMYKVVVPYDFPVLEVAGIKMGDSVGRVFMCIVKSVHAVISLFGQTKEQLKEDDEDDDDDAATEKPTRFNDRKDENHMDAGNKIIPYLWFSMSQASLTSNSYKVVVPYDFPVLEVAGMKMGDSVGRIFMCIVKSVHAVISLFGQTKEQLKEDDEDDDDDAATEKPTRFNDRKDENHMDAGNILEVAGMKMGDSVGRVFMCIIKSVHAVISLFGQTKEQLKEDDEDDDDDAATEKPTRFDDRKDENHRDAGNSNSRSQVNHSSYTSKNLISKATVNRKLIILPTPRQILYQRQQSIAS